MGLYRRGETYWFTLMHDGQRIRESLKTDNRKLAEKVYAKKLVDIVEGRYFEATTARTTTFDEMVEKYLSKHAHSRDGYTKKPLLDFFGGMMLSQITTPLVADYQDERLEEVKEATVYQELSLLRRMFNVARKRWKWVKDNPVSDGDLSFSVGSRNARDRWLTVEEEDTLLEKATNPVWLRALLITALHTGMRRGELLALTRKDIDFPRRLVRVERSKNGEKRSIPMSQTLYETLQTIKVRDISGTLFPIAIRSLRAAYDEALAKAGITDFHFHDLRHTFATRLVQNGVDLYKVQKLLGHKNIAMTERYAHHYPESLRSSVEVLDVCHNLVTLRRGEV
ncbi:MAG: site-specific integrase [Syntrophorhabdales bacterium]|jgi:integrase